MLTFLLFKSYPSSRSPLGGSSLSQPSKLSLPKTLSPEGEFQKLLTLGKSRAHLMQDPCVTRHCGVNTLNWRVSRLYCWGCLLCARPTFGPPGRRQTWEGVFLCVAPGYFIFSWLITGEWEKRDYRIGLISREMVRCGYVIHSGFSFLKSHQTVEEHGLLLTHVHSVYPAPTSSTNHPMTPIPTDVSCLRTPRAGVGKP